MALEPEKRRRAFVNIHVDATSLGGCKSTVARKIVEKIVESKRNNPDATHFDLYFDRGIPKQTKPKGKLSPTGKDVSWLVKLRHQVDLVSGLEYPERIITHPQPVDVSNILWKIPKPLQEFLDDENNRVIIDTKNYTSPRSSAEEVLEQLLPELENYDEIVVQGVHFSKKGEGCVNEAIGVLKRLEQKGIKITLNTEAMDCQE